MNDNLKISDAAKFLGISNDTLRRWELQGKITALRSTHDRRSYSLLDLTQLKEAQDDLLSISEAAKLLKVSTKTLRRWDQSGKLTPIRGSKERLYSRQNILAMSTSSKKKKSTSEQKPAVDDIALPKQDWEIFAVKTSSPLIIRPIDQKIQFAEIKKGVLLIGSMTLLLLAVTLGLNTWNPQLANDFFTKNTIGRVLAPANNLSVASIQLAKQSLAINRFELALSPAPARHSLGSSQVLGVNKTISLPIYGSSKIEAAKKEVIVTLPASQSAYLVFLTPTSVIEGNIYVKSNGPDSFTVALTKKNITAVSFNWWIERKK